MRLTWTGVWSRWIAPFLVWSVLALLAVVIAWYGFGSLLPPDTKTQIGVIIGPLISLMGMLLTPQILSLLSFSSDVLQILDRARDPHHPRDARAPATRSHPSRSSLFLMPYLKPQVFVGRDRDLADIHAAFAGARSLVLLSGMPGAGKTHLSVQYAYQYARDYPDGVFWLSARDSFDKAFADFGRKIRVRQGATVIEESERALAETFIHYLDDNDTVLLIIDDLDNPTELTLPIMGELLVNKKCKILGTTRWTGSTDRKDLQFDLFTVLPLGSRDAVELLERSLQARTGSGHPGILAQAQELGAIKDICTMLGGLPKAIALVAAYLNEKPSIKCSEYRDLIRKAGTAQIPGFDALRAVLDRQWSALESETGAMLLAQTIAILGHSGRIPVASFVRLDRIDR